MEAAGLQTLLTDRIEAGSAVAAFAVEGRPECRAAPPATPGLAGRGLTERERVVLGCLASTLSNTNQPPSCTLFGEHRENPPAHGLQETRRRRSTRRRATRASGSSSSDRRASSPRTALAAAFERRPLR